jgi:Rrf2 family protein
MFTQKTRYSIMALVRLAKEYKKGTLLIQEIADSEKIPKRFLETILLELKKKGYLGSKIGKNGGYYLIKDPIDITLLEVVRHVEGTIALIPCTSEKYYQACEHCKDEGTCKIRQTFWDIRNYTYNKMQDTTFADLVDDENGFNSEK